MLQCDAPRNSGWRPGARWARSEAAAPKGQSRRDVEMQIAALPLHQRPPMRMLGRSSEAADHPFKAMPPDEGTGGRGAALHGEGRQGMREMARRTEAAEHPFRRLPGDDGGTPALARQPHVRRGYNDPHSAPPGVKAYFDTGRTSTHAGRSNPGHALPIVTVHKTGSRVEVAAASPAAAALGITPGMALTQVRASAPEVIVRDADPTGDAADLVALAMLLARRWTPIVARSDDDGLFLDMTGVTHLYGGEERFARRLVRLLDRAGFRARIAIADTAGAAWALARHDGAPITLCPPGTHEAAIAPLPAAALRFEERPLELLRRLGVETVADVAALPRAPFVRRFGATAARRLDQALGTVAEPLDPVVPPEAVQVTQRFAEPIASAEAIAHWLGQLVPRLTAALAEAGLGARALCFVADRVDGVPQPIRVGFARASRDPAHLQRLIARRIEEIAPGYGVDALHLRVIRTEQLGPQPFGDTLDMDAADLAGLVDTLANRAAPVWRTTPVASHVPERSVAQAAPLDPPASDRRRPKRDHVGQLDARTPDHPWHPRRPRPVQLLRHPEQLDHVMAELPDRPPLRFTWRGKRHVVVRADGPERIAGEWWRRTGERDAVRDYFRVEDEEGQRFWLFRRGDGERAATGDLTWYLHGRFG